MNAADPRTWSDNWAWSLPLIVLSVVIHVLGLQFIHDRVARVLNGAAASRRYSPVFAVVVGASALLATILHGIEVGICASPYLVAP